MPSRRIPAAVLIVLLACSCVRAAPGSQLESGADYKAAAAAPNVVASLSVIAHTLWPPGVARELRLMSLETATRTLAAATGPDALFRKKRAIVRLLAYGRLGEKYETELGILGVDPSAIASIRRQVLARSPVEAHVLELDVRWLFLQVWRVLGENLGWWAGPGAVATCATSADLVGVPNFPYKNPIVIGATISIKASLLTTDAAEANLDPQRWDNCSHYWKPPEHGTYLCEMSGSGPPSTPAPTPIPVAPTPVPGSAYGSKPFYEDFKCPSGLCRIRQILNGNAQMLPGGKMQFNYSLLENPSESKIEADVLGLPVELVSDFGFIWIWEDSGRTFVQSEKTLDFRQTAITPQQLKWLIVVFTDLAEDLASLACCA